MLQVAAAVIRNGKDEMLLARRGPGRDDAGLWEFPGGKLEAGEDARAAIVREIREELGIELFVKGVLLHTVYEAPARAIALTFLDCTVRAGAPTAREHAELRWVRPEDAPGMALCPADRAALPALIARGRPAYAHSSEEGLFQPLEEHLLATARLAEAFAQAFDCGDWGYALGLLHDVGKARPAFFHRLEGGKTPVEHAAAGALLAKRRGGLVEAALAPCVAGHHAGLADPMPADYGQRLTPVCERLAREERRPAVREVVPVRWPAARPKMRLTGVRKGQGFSFALWQRMLFSCLVDADFLDTEAFMQGPQPRGRGEDVHTLRARLDAYMERFSHPKNPIDEKRCAILADCRRAAEGPQGLYTLTVPTGGGKTLASLAFALRHAEKHGLRRVIYVIPYTSIISQTAKKFREALGEENVLEHTSIAEAGGAERATCERATCERDGAERATCERDDAERDDAEDEAVRARRLAAENWDAPVIVTTNVQFFESLMANRPARCRKLHNIARSVVIFDEAQMLPTGYLIPCTRLIEELAVNYRATAVLCTATQPALGRYLGGLNATEICRDTAGLYEFFRRVRYEVAGVWEDERIWAEFRAQRQMLAVVNSRAHAQALYDGMAGEGVFCLTTLLTPQSREDKLEEIRARLKGGRTCRVVSTSLIEAGVDVDFPRVCREAAGLDSVIQAAGRCNREGGHSAQESVVTVFHSGEKWRDKVPKALKRPADVAAEILETEADIASPEAVGRYFTRLYALTGSGLDVKGIEKMLDDGGSAPPFEEAARAFRLIEEGTRAVLIPTTKEARTCAERLGAGERSRELWRQAARCSVSVYEGDFQALHAAGKLDVLDEQIAVLLDAACYDPDKGLCVPGMGAGIMI